ncbi:hypothetical protein H0H93_013854 [Arthromyces matolae]|nr:hypothetical protein H0H93_013854 [Arthromyces matolae]
MASQQDKQMADRLKARLQTQLNILNTDKWLKKSGESQSFHRNTIADLERDLKSIVDGDEEAISQSLTDLEEDIRTLEEAIKTHIWSQMPTQIPEEPRYGQGPQMQQIQPYVGAMGYSQAGYSSPYGPPQLQPQAVPTHGYYPQSGLVPPPGSGYPPTYNPSGTTNQGYYPHFPPSYGNAQPVHASSSQSGGRGRSNMSDVPQDVTFTGGYRDSMGGEPSRYDSYEQQMMFDAELFRRSSGSSGESFRKQD